MDQPKIETNNSAPTNDPVEAPVKKKSFIARILRGDILLDIITKEVFAGIIVVAILGMIYISNRYSVQQKQLDVYKLKTELQDIKYKALVQKAMLLHTSRQSKIEEYLKKTGSSLEIPSNPPYRIK